MKKSIGSNILIPIGLIVACLVGLILFLTFKTTQAPHALVSFGAIQVRTVKAPTSIDQKQEQMPIAMIKPLERSSPSPIEQEPTMTQTPANTTTNTASPSRTPTNIPTLTPNFSISPTATISPTGANISTQSSRIETFTIAMPQLGNRQRSIEVYLPPDYNTSNLSYPVIYFFDGDSLFNPPPNAVGDWLVDETLDELYDKNLTEGIIVVGIAYDPDYPWSEYIPWINPNMHDWVKAKNSEPTEGGEGEAFLNFIIDTLKPEVDSRYRTLSDRDNTMIGGPCRTAMLPIYAGLSRPDIFSKVMVMSPAVWLGEAGGPWLSNNQLLEFIEKAEAPADLRIYIDIGTEESSGDQPKVFDQDGKRITYPQAYVEGAEILFRALSSQGIPEDNLRFEIFEGAKGIRNEWAKRFGSAILWLLQNN